MKNTFGINIIPENDEDRISVLRLYEILDTPPEESFNKIAMIATRLFKVPIALVSLVDRDRVFFKANVGMPGVENVDRGVSLCSLAVLNDDVTVFRDALKESCLLANPLVAGEFGLRFYAGAPLHTREGYNVGAMCIVDKKSREFSEEQQAALKDLADLVIAELELRRAVRSAVDALQRSNENLEEKIRFRTLELERVNREYEVKIKELQGKASS